MKRLLLAVVWAALLVLAAADFGHAAVINTTWTNSGGDYNWGTASNWMMGLPDNDATNQYVAQIYAGHTISVNGAFTVNAVDNYGGILNIGYGNSLALVTGPSTNLAQIRLNDISPSSVNQARLFINGAVNLSGTGSVEFATNYQNEISGGGYLTMGLGHTIHAGTGTKGYINVGMTNQGIVSAEGGTVVLQSANKINQGVIQAIDDGGSVGGTLDITGITLDNTAGTLGVYDHSTLKLNSAVIKGGISGNGNVDVGGTTSLIDGTGGAVLTPTITVNYSEALHLKGSITNNGQIRLNDISSASSNQAKLFIDGAVALGGTGSVEFLTLYQNQINDGGSGHLTVGAGQTIRAGTGTKGYINVGMTNQGLVSAQGGTITLQTTDKINQGIIQAIGGGTLDITGIILDNTAGTLTAGAGSTVKLNNSVLQGGISGAGNVDVAGTTSLIDGTAGAILTPTITTGYGQALHLKGDITNNGQIRLNDISSASSNQARLFIDGAVNLSGTGSVEFLTLHQNQINDGGSGHLTVGAGQTIRAGAGTKGYINVGTTNHGILEADGGTITLPTLLTNNGLVRSAGGSTLAVANSVGGTGGWQADGGTLDVNSDVSTSGDIDVRNSGELDLAASKTMTGHDLFMDTTGVLSIGDGATLALGGSLSFAMTDESMWSFGAGSSLLMNGGLGYQSLEIGGEDLGLDAAGFSDNFDLDIFGLQGSGTFAYLSDALDNGNRHSPEALYVSDLSVLAGTTLNLNGLSLYTYLDDVLHLVAAGEGYLFGGGQIVDFDQPSAVPVPGAVWLLGSGLLGLVGLRRKFG